MLIISWHRQSIEKVGPIQPNKTAYKKNSASETEGRDRYQAIFKRTNQAFIKGKLTFHDILRRRESQHTHPFHWRRIIRCALRYFYNSPEVMGKNFNVMGLGHLLPPVTTVSCILHYTWMMFIAFIQFVICNRTPKVKKCCTNNMDSDLMQLT